jgi:hypothetical protein
MLDKTGEIEENILSYDINIRLLKLTKETEGNPFPGRNARTHAQSGISFLQGSEGVSSNPASQTARLVEWARKSNLLIDKLPFRIGGPQDKGGGEKRLENA